MDRPLELRAAGADACEGLIQDAAGRAVRDQDVRAWERLRYVYYIYIYIYIYIYLCLFWVCGVAQSLSQCVFA